MRFFFISYSYVNRNGTGFGCFGLTSTTGFPSLGRIQRAIQSETIQNVIPISVQEMSEQDFTECFESR